MSNVKDTAAHMTTKASMMFQISRKYDPWWRMMPESITCARLGGGDQMGKVNSFHWVCEMVLIKVNQRGVSQQPKNINQNN